MTLCQGTSGALLQVDKEAAEAELKKKEEAIQVDWRFPENALALWIFEDQDDFFFDVYSQLAAIPVNSAKSPVPGYEFGTASVIWKWWYNPQGMAMSLGKWWSEHGNPHIGQARRDEERMRKEEEARKVRTEDTDFCPAVGAVTFSKDEHRESCNYIIVMCIYIYIFIYISIQYIYIYLYIYPLFIYI